MQLLAFVQLALFSAMALASPAPEKPSGTEMAKRATCTVNSVATAADLSDCSTVVIEAFSVPSGNVITIAAADGATVTMSGSISFSKTTSSGPLFTLDTDNVKFNGNGYSFKGNGDLYWDGLGTASGTTKPHPFVKFKGYGTFTDFVIKNSPAHAISVGTTGGSAVFSDVLVDNLDGDALNSDGDALGHNTDGFDVSASSVTIENSKVYNQDDCIAINSGSTIVFSGNYCSGGHGISVGSIADAKVVSGVTITGNTVVTSMYGMRIKVDSDATGSVSGITYIGNTISGIDKYGFLISQSYSDDFGTPGTASTISGVTFSGATTTITATTTKYPRVGVDCGHCTGAWSWSSLSATGGEASDIILTGGATISGGTY